MTMKGTTRRALLRRAVELPLVGVTLGWVISACGGKSGACFDPASASADAKAMRESFHYAETSPDATKTCLGCSFFTGQPNSCGTCQVFSGPANAGGHCDSWAMRS